MNTLIKVCKYIFITLTAVVVVTSLVGMFGGHTDPMIVLVYVVLAFSGIGVIASWRERK